MAKNINEIKEETKKYLENKVTNLIYDFESNLAQIINTEIKEYNLDWCEEEGNTRDIGIKDEIVEDFIKHFTRAEIDILFKNAK